MIYEYNGEYYIKVAHTFNKSNAECKENGDIRFTPVYNSSIKDTDFKGVPVTYDKIRDDFKKKNTSKEVKEHNSFKKINKYSKNI